MQPDFRVDLTSIEFIRFAQKYTDFNKREVGGVCHVPIWSNLTEGHGRQESVWLKFGRPVSGFTYLVLIDLSLLFPMHMHCVAVGNHMVSWSERVDVQRKLLIMQMHVSQSWVATRPRQ